MRSKTGYARRQSKRQQEGKHRVHAQARCPACGRKALKVVEANPMKGILKFVDSKGHVFGIAPKEATA